MAQFLCLTNNNSTLDIYAIVELPEYCRDIRSVHSVYMTNLLAIL